MGTYIEAADVSRRLGPETYAAIFDDDRNAAADTAVVDDFILDAESEVEQVIERVYGDAGLAALQALGTNCPRSVKRMVLDLLELRAYRRHPGFIRAYNASGEREKVVREDLNKLRLRELDLGTTGEPETAIADQVKHQSSDANSATRTPREPTFIGNMGDY